MENSKEGAKTIQIKGGREIMFDGGRYNNETITDKIALAMLKKHPEYEKFFIIPAAKSEPETVEAPEEVETETVEAPKKKRATKKKVANESN